MPEVPDDAMFADGQSLYLRAFSSLMWDRQFDAAGKPLPIPYVAISHYARDHALPPDVFPEFCQLVRALDEEWRAHVVKTTPSEPTR